MKSSKSRAIIQEIIISDVDISDNDKLYTIELKENV